MKSIRIELSNYEGRELDINTMAYVASKYDLDYSVAALPVMTIYDDETDNVILKSEGGKICYINGADSNIEQFLCEVKKWIY